MITIFDDRGYIKRTIETDSDRHQVRGLLGVDSVAAMTAEFAGNPAYPHRRQPVQETKPQSVPRWTMME